MKQGERNESFFLTLLLHGILLVLLMSYFSAEAQELKKGDVESIAKEASQEVGVVEKKALQGKKGAPIVILEENHTSRAGQIQNAITLVRLHERYDLKHIALEGYLKERPEIKTDWFVKAACGMSSAAKNRVAVRLLREGEISCAEFMKLVYDDVQLHPIETSTEYIIELDVNASTAPILYLLKIAQQSLREEHVPKLKQLQEDIEKLKAEKDSEALGKKAKEMFDYILSFDSWTQDKAKILQDKDAIRFMSGEQHLKLIEEIVNHAKSLSIEFEQEEKDAMEKYLAFWRGRVKASKTMTLATSVIADQPNVPVVAMVIGAAHTEGMCAMFKTDGRPFVVVTPLSLKRDEQAGDISLDMLERKYQKISVYSEGFSKIFLNAFLPLKKKPEPALPEPWFQGKAEMYLFTERIVRGILSLPKPSAENKPPFGFNDDAFRGRWSFVNPNRISIIPDTPDGKGQAVLFPVMLNSNDPRAKEIWVKAGLGVAIVPEQERESIESMLRKALEGIQGEKELSKKTEDEAGRVQITLNTVAAFAGTQEAARKVVLGAI